MNEAETQVLAIDIQEKGVIDPIVLFHGKILDGKNRYEQARKYGVPIKTIEFKGDDDKALGYIISKNLFRRQMNESQRAVSAAKLLGISSGINYKQILANAQDVKVPAIKVKDRAEIEAQMNTSPRQVTKKKCD